MAGKLGKTVPVVVSMAVGAGIALAAEKIQRPPIAPTQPQSAAAPIQKGPSSARAVIAPFGGLTGVSTPRSRSELASPLADRLIKLGAERLLREAASALGEANLSSKQPPGVQRQSKGFDASEGTPRDPLLNTTYDLNYVQNIPKLDKGP